MKKLLIFQPIVFNMKEIKMANILFGQVEKSSNVTMKFQKYQPIRNEHFLNRNFYLF